MNQHSILEFSGKRYVATLKSDNKIDIHIDDEPIKTLDDYIPTVNHIRFINGESLPILLLYSDNCRAVYSLKDDRIIEEVKTTELDHQSLVQDDCRFILSINPQQLSSGVWSHKVAEPETNSVQLLDFNQFSPIKAMMHIDEVTGALYVALLGGLHHYISIFNIQGEVVYQLQLPCTDFAFTVKRNIFRLIVKTRDKGNFAYTCTENTVLESTPIRYDFTDADSVGSYFALFLDESTYEGRTPIMIAERHTLLKPDVRKPTESSLIPDQCIGKGTYGEVYTAQHDGKQVALKAFKDQSYEDMYEEAIALSQLRHPNIIPLLQIIENETMCAITLPLAEYGSLRQFIKLPQYANQGFHSDFTCIAYGIASALEYLETHRIVHRDLKTANVVVSRGSAYSYKAIIIDAGFAAPIPEDKRAFNAPFAGTQVYAPPEALSPPETDFNELPCFTPTWDTVIASNSAFSHPSDSVEETASSSTDKGVVIDKSIDLYSLACILYEMGRRKAPWVEYEWANHYNNVTQGYRKNPVNNTPDKLYKLIGQCYAQNPEDRPTAKDAVAIIRAELAKPQEMPEFTEKGYESTIHIDEWPKGALRRTVNTVERDIQAVLEAAREACLDVDVDLVLGAGAGAGAAELPPQRRRGGPLKRTRRMPPEAPEDRIARYIRVTSGNIPGQSDRPGLFAGQGRYELRDREELAAQREAALERGGLVPY